MQTTYLSMYIGALQVPVVMMMMMMNILYAMYLVQLLIRKKQEKKTKKIWLSVDHCRLRPVNDMVLLGCMVGDSGFVMFC